MMRALNYFHPLLQQKNPIHNFSFLSSKAFKNNLQFSQISF